MPELYSTVHSYQVRPKTSLAEFLLLHLFPPKEASLVLNFFSDFTVQVAGYRLRPAVKSPVPLHVLSETGSGIFMCYLSTSMRCWFVP